MYAGPFYILRKGEDMNTIYDCVNVFVIPYIVIIYVNLVFAEADI